MAQIEARIKQTLTPKILSYRPCAIVIGRAGTGKTTLVNNVCGTQHQAGEGRGSVTRKLFCNYVNCGNYIFSLMDTPGTNSSTETYKHALLLREGLTATKINTIFIIVKYDGRFDQMIENYFEVEQPVYNYTSKVVVIISHWDQSKDPQNSFKEICSLFQEECPQVTNLIFCSERSSKSKIANLMYSCISNMTEEKLNISENEFFLKFNICQMKSQMKISFKEYQRKADLLVQDYAELIHSVESRSVEVKDEALHMAIIKFKDEMETLLQEFRQQHGGAMEELDYYAFYIKMEKENVRICDEFVEKVAPLISYNLFDNKDPRNLIKRCPHCDLIWFKTEGCDGGTTCGNNEFTGDMKVISKAFWKYQLTRIGGKLTLEKNPNRKSYSNEDNKDAKVKLPRAAQSKPVGCGKRFDWGDQPKIEDELILELFKVKTIDQAKQMIQSGSFREARQNYESSIDFTIFS